MVTAIPPSPSQIVVVVTPVGGSAVGKITVGLVVGPTATTVGAVQQLPTEGLSAQAF